MTHPYFFFKMYFLVIYGKMHLTVLYLDNFLKALYWRWRRLFTCFAARALIDELMAWNICTCLGTILPAYHRGKCAFISHNLAPTYSLF
jgi:hypothetical protein